MLYKDSSLFVIPKGYGLFEIILYKKPEALLRVLDVMV